MELIKVTSNEDGKQVVSARELHEGLGIKTEFRKWFPRMCEYGFEENKDYVKVTQKCLSSQTGQNQTDYVIAIDMAKEISMIQRSELGKRFRQYFIECENNQKKALKQLETVELDNISGYVYGKNGIAITNSNIIADTFDKRHDNVVEDIRKKIRELSETETGKQFSLLNFQESNYVNELGREYVQYELTEQGFCFVVLGYTGTKANEFKIKFINDFFNMRTTILNMYKARLIENVLPQKTGDRQFVYIIRNKDSGNIKIGVGNNPEKRLKQLQTGNDCELEIAYTSYVCSNSFEIESIVHKEFKDTHVRGEWYNANVDDVISFMESERYVLNSVFVSDSLKTNADTAFKHMLIR